MKCNISQRIIDDINRIAEKNGINKVILFGSRAKGTNAARSDIDLAVSGGNVIDFHLDLEEEIWTLLKFDVINLDKGIDDELKNEIERDGIVIYEKI